MNWNKIPPIINDLIKNVQTLWSSEKIANEIQNVQSSVDNHVGREDNPHCVTTKQIGAETPEGAQQKVDVAKTAAINAAAADATKKVNSHVNAETAHNWKQISGKPTTLQGYGVESQVDTKDLAIKASANLYTDGAVATLVNTAPEALDTLYELSNALGNDPNFASTMTKLIGTKATKATTLAGYGIADAYTKSQVDTSVNTKLSYDNVGDGIRVIRDAAQYNSNSIVTGAIKITIPTGLTSEVMLKMRIEGYVYATADSWTLNIEAHLNNRGTEWNRVKTLLTPNAAVNGVRFGHDGTCLCILLGTTTTVWNYPKINIAELMVGYVAVASFPSKLDISLITDETGITFTDGIIKTLATTDGSIAGNAATATNLLSTTIPLNADLNNYTLPGMYYCPQNVIVATIKNCPTGFAFSLLVERHAGHKQTLTEFVISKNPKIWYRNCYTGTWGEWKEIATTDNPVFSGNIGINTTSPTVISGYGGISLNGTTGGILNFQANGNKIGSLHGTTSGLCLTTLTDLPIVFTVDNIQRVAVVGNAFRPTTDNVCALGHSSYRFSQIYAATATISTSDRNAKTDILDTTLGLDFINSLRPVEFKYKVRQNEVTSEQDGTELVEIEPERKEIKVVTPAVYETVVVSEAEYTTIEVTPASYDDEGNVITEAITEEILVKEAVTEEQLVQEEVTEEIIIPAITEERPIYKEVVTPLPGIRTHVGLIAQEVEAALEGKDIGLLTKDRETGQYGLRYEEFIGPLIKAVQELSARVDQQAAEIIMLKQQEP